MTRAVAALLALLLTACATPAHDRWIARDKAIHAAGSGALVLATQYLGEVTLGASRWHVLPVSVGLALAAGVTKEATDREWSWKDIAADAAGTAGGVVLIAW